MYHPTRIRDVSVICSLLEEIFRSNIECASIAYSHITEQPERIARDTSDDSSRPLPRPVQGKTHMRHGFVSSFSPLWND
jgi:hypothetical protein